MSQDPEDDSARRGEAVKALRRGVDLLQQRLTGFDEVFQGAALAVEGGTRLPVHPARYAELATAWEQLHTAWDAYREANAEVVAGFELVPGEESRS